jgi:lipoate-protein ligase A
MQLLDQTFSTPAENLACDEALLDFSEENGGEGFLRFWESPEIFVVVGYGNKIADEVNVAHCAAKKIPVLRRCSGGGTVLQGPGCLNYALILPIKENSPLATISGTNRFIMEKNRAAIELEIRNQKLKIEISICGHTDLAINSQLSTLDKFSGNSQRRRKNFLLFHGTFLLNFNFALVEEFLLTPSREPDYRKNREHQKFLTNLNLTPEILKTVLAENWHANISPENNYSIFLKKLVSEKYSQEKWNNKF